MLGLAGVTHSKLKYAVLAVYDSLSYLNADYLDKRRCCRIWSVSLDPHRDPLQTVEGYRSVSET